MQAQMNRTRATHSRPSMNMWEWFDMWALYEEVTRRFGSRNLFEDEDEEDYSDEEKAKHHDFYVKHFNEVLHNHNRMSAKDSKDRLAQVGQWASEPSSKVDIRAGLRPRQGRTERGRVVPVGKDPVTKKKQFVSSEAPGFGEKARDFRKRRSEWHKGLRADGHDLKSAHSAAQIVTAVSGSKHGHILLRAAKSLAGDPHKSPERHRGISSTTAKSVPGGGKTSPDEDKHFIGATLMTRHGEAQSAHTNEETKRLHARLKARRDHAASKVEPLEPRGEEESEEAWGKRASAHDSKVNKAESDIESNDKHGYASISTDTNHTEDQVKAHRQRIYGKRAGAHLSPIRDLARQAMAHIEPKKDKDGNITGPGGKLSHEWVARAAKQLAIQRRSSHETSKKADSFRKAVDTGHRLGGDDEDQAKGMAGISQSSGKLATRVKTGETVNPKWHHPASKRAKDTGITMRGRDGSPSAEAHEAANKALGVTRKRASIDIGTAIKTLTDKGHDPKSIARLLQHPHGQVMRRLAGFSPTGAERGGGASGKRAGAREKRDQQPVKSAMRAEREAKIAKGKSPTEAVKADLHRLYPKRDEVGEGQDDENPTGSFAGRIHKMYHGEKDAKGNWISQPMPHKKDVQADEEQPDKLGVRITPGTARAGFTAGRNISGASPLEHPGKFDEEAAHKQHDGDEKKIEHARRSHETRLDRFHDRMADNHDGVHKAMDKILANVKDRNHHLTVQHREHHDALKLAKNTNNERDVEELTAHGKKMNIMDDIIDHHMNHAQHDPDVKKALGGSLARVRSGLTNIQARLRKHGEHSMAARILRGGASQKARGGEERGKGRPGDPLSRQRVRVPGSESGAGGDIESPTKHKPEQYIEPTTQTRKVKMRTARGEPAGTANRPVPSVATRILDKRAQAARTASAMAKHAASKAAKEAAKSREDAQERATMQRPGGAGGPIGPKPIPGADKEAERRRARGDAAMAAKKSLADKVAAAPSSKTGKVGTPETSSTSPATQARYRTYPSKSTPTSRAQITPTTSDSPRIQAPSRPEPGTPGGRRPEGEKKLVRARPTGRKGEFYVQPASSPRSAPGRLARRKKKKEKTEGEKKMDALFRKPDNREESLFVRTRLVINESSSLLNRTPLSV